MTLTGKVSARYALFTLVVLALVSGLFEGNQRRAHASLPPPDFGEQIVCLVFSHLNETGSPIPFLKSEGCPDDSEQIPQCQDDIDNDGDGKIDLDDPGCQNANDNNESNPPAPPSQCSDGTDNDGDGKVDLADPGCSDPSDNNETNSGPLPQCADGTDNDGDGKTDLSDPGCSGASDNDETNTDDGGDGNGSDDAACEDGEDNDGDGSIDFPADSSCDSLNDDSESGGEGGGGSSGGGGKNRRSTATSTPAVLGVTSNEECPAYLNEYIKWGGQNNPAEVLKLQQFLRDLNGFGNLQETGIYDAATYAAVREFQQMYAEHILSPWGITQPTGYVYHTTKKTINEIHCEFTKEFPLTADQATEIARVKALGAMWKPSTPLAVPLTPKIESINTPKSSSQTGVPISSGETQPPVVEGVSTKVKTSLFGVFWNWVFGRPEN